VPIKRFFIQQHYGKSLLSLHQILTEAPPPAAGCQLSAVWGRIEARLPNSIAARIVAFAGPIPEICINS